MAGLFPSITQLELLQVYLDLRPSHELLKKFWHHYTNAHNDSDSSGKSASNRDAVDGENSVVGEMPLFSDSESVEYHFGTVEKFRRELEKYITADPKHKKAKKRIKRSRELFAESNGLKGRTQLHKLLEKFWNQCQLDDTGVYSLCNLEEKIGLSKVIKDLPMSFQDR